MSHQLPSAAPDWAAFGLSPAHCVVAEIMFRLASNPQVFNEVVAGMGKPAPLEGRDASRPATLPVVVGRMVGDLSRECGFQPSAQQECLDQASAAFGKLAKFVACEGDAAVHAQALEANRRLILSGRPFLFLP